MFPNACHSFFDPSLSILIVVVTGLLIAGCTAKSFWLLARHGTRNPGEDDISLMEIKAPDIQAAILDNYQNGRGKVRVLFKILQLYSVINKSSYDFVAQLLSNCTSTLTTFS